MCASEMFGWLSLIVVCAFPALVFTTTTPYVSFPFQKANLGDDKTFFRIHGDNTIEKLTCPDGFSFDAGEMKCVFDKKLTKDGENVGNCPSNFRGTLPNPENCRHYFNCWDGIGYEMECNAHLLYNSGLSACDWPEKAGCCEYIEKDPNQIVP